MTNSRVLYSLDITSAVQLFSMSVLGFHFIWQLNVGEHTDQDMTEIIGEVLLVLGAA